MTAAAVEHLDHFQHRVIQDALTDATAIYWRRRAETFDWARPRPGDYIPPGRETHVSQLDARLAELAEACRARARIAVVDEWPTIERRAVA